MTTEALTSPQSSSPGLLSRAFAGRSGPLAVVILAIIALWYLGAVWLNAPLLIDGYERREVDWDFTQLASDAMAMERPVLPAPHQVAQELNTSILGRAVTSKRSLVYHAWVTLSSTLLGFVMGTVLGILLAVGIVHVKTLDRSLLPWVIASQTIPILAIAPMIIVVLGNIGFTGLVPKALISMYLCFFPVTIGMVKGLRSPDRLQRDLMRTYSASVGQVFWKLRWPSSVPFLFASLKVAIAISLVGAIVGELPTGAQAGIGARLLVGSYYGQTVQIWAALLTAAAMAGLLVAAMGGLEKLVNRRMGVQA
jgi:NitT/TauT family transport system permease protein